MISRNWNRITTFLGVIAFASLIAFSLFGNAAALAQRVIVNPTTEIRPLGYAYVQSNGSINPSLTRNITSENIVNNGSGIYGFRNLTFTPRNIQVTLAFDTQAVTGDNRTGARGFIGNCSFIGGVDQACVSINSDPDTAASTRRDDFFVVFY